MATISRSKRSIVSSSRGGVRFMASRCAQRRNRTADTGILKALLYQPNYLGPLRPGARARLESGRAHLSAAALFVKHVCLSGRAAPPSEAVDVGGRRASP